MTPSKNIGITAGQIGKIQELLGAALRKSGLLSEPTQQVLKHQGKQLADEFVAAVRKRVEATSNMIARRVKADRTKSPQQALDATRRQQYTDRDVVEGMPKGELDEEDIYLFKPDLSARGGHISDDDLEKEFDARGFKPADPYKLAKFNADDPAFADEHPNGTHWKDATGRWCFAAFDRWFGGRLVYVNRHDDVWNDSCWFAGSRK